jgi:Ca2+-binding EF-hand superfamily protein
MIQTKTLLACLAAATFALSSSAAPVEDHPGAVKTLNRCDQNNDSKISMEEFVDGIIDEAKKAKKERAFKKFDTNQDGFITLDELNKRMHQVQPLQ